NGNRTDILKDENFVTTMKALRLDYLFRKKLDIGEFELLNHNIRYKDIHSIYDLVKSAGYNIVLDERYANFELICKNIKNLDAITTLLKTLNTAQFITQSSFLSVINHVQHFEG